MKNNFLITILYRAIFACMLLIVGLVTAESLTACEETMILEKKDVQFLNIVQSEKSPVRLNITGLIFHSSLAVGEIKTYQLNDVLQINIYLKPVSAGLSGNISYNLLVPETVRKVVLGKGQEVIWVRK